MNELKQHEKLSCKSLKCDCHYDIDEVLPDQNVFGDNSVFTCEVTISDLKQHFDVRKIPFTRRNLINLLNETDFPYDFAEEIWDKVKQTISSLITEYDEQGVFGKKEITGRDILLVQLQYLYDYLCVTNDNFNYSDHTQSALNLKKELSIPDHLDAAWYSYYAEFLSDPQGALAENNIFYEEDIMEGIIDKFVAFYAPIAYLVCKKLQQSLYSTNVTVEPSWKNSTHVIIVADSKDRSHGALLYSTKRKAWNFYFDNLPSLYKLLEETFGAMMCAYKSWNLSKLEGA